MVHVNRTGAPQVLVLVPDLLTRSIEIVTAPGVLFCLNFACCNIHISLPVSLFFPLGASVERLYVISERPLKDATTITGVVESKITIIDKYPVSSKNCI